MKRQSAVGCPYTACTCKPVSHCYFTASVALVSHSIFRLDSGVCLSGNLLQLLGCTSRCLHMASVRAPSCVSEAETRYTGPRWDGIVAEVLGDCFDSLKDHPGDAAHFCNHDPTRWHRSQCKFDFTPEEFQREQQQHIDEGREIILSQPPQFVNFTQSGYEARDLEQVLGTDLLGEVRHFWLGNRLRGSVPENNAKLDLALSSCESNSWLLPLPDEMKLRVFNAVQPHLAGWIGMSGDDLEPTAMYGVRMYRNGSVLNLHVDKPHTHAVSAILEIGHLGFGHPDSEFEQQEPSWPLRILNHKGEEKLVPNRAGQAIFYESATCPHGRPSVLHSREFANVFVHFRPKAGPDRKAILSVSSPSSPSSPLTLRAGLEISWHNDP